jgi:hypothetical protein
MLTYRAGDLVQVEFRDDQTGASELIWVKVDWCDERSQLIFGTLDSRPGVHLQKLRPGQPLTTSYENIRDHWKSPDYCEE